jgi:type II secretory pathway component GspD/PulD (secretin)
MQLTFRRVVWVAGILVAAALTPAAQAQVQAVARANSVPVGTIVAVQTTVSVPDGGTVSLGSYSRYSESRTEYGTPVLGKIPYVSRGFRNVGYGRSVSSVTVTASVRIIDLADEEYRQTGVRSR